MIKSPISQVVTFVLSSVQKSSVVYPSEITLLILFSMSFWGRSRRISCFQ